MFVTYCVTFGFRPVILAAGNLVKFPCAKLQMLAAEGGGGGGGRGGGGGGDLGELTNDPATMLRPVRSNQC